MYFKVHSRFTFMNLKNARLVLKVKCEIVVLIQLTVSDLSMRDKENIVQVVAFIESIYAYK